MPAHRDGHEKRVIHNENLKNENMCIYMPGYMHLLI